MESTNLPSELAKDSRLALPGGGFADKANHTDSILNRGFDIGGPIVKDKALVLGVVGQAEHRHRPAQADDRQDGADEHEREDQLGADDERSVLGLLLQRREGEVRPRRQGYVANEPTSFLWNQGNFYPEDGVLHPLHGLWKVEDNHTFGSNLFVNGSTRGTAGATASTRSAARRTTAASTLDNSSRLRFVRHRQVHEGLAPPRRQRQRVRDDRRRQPRVQVRLRLQPAGRTIR